MRGVQEGQTPQVVVHDNETNEDYALYATWPHQERFHQSNAKNVLALGTRGTGKSKMLRWDAIIRCMMFPNFRALVLRREMPQLRESHLVHIGAEMAQLGGESKGYVYLSTTHTAKFPNGSAIVFAHCETPADVMNFLSSEYGLIIFDELSTFELDQFLKISAAARAPENVGYIALVRCGSNPIGIGADWMYSWFVDKDVDKVQFPFYNPAKFEMQFSTLADNPSLNIVEYTETLQNLPEHMRRGWLYGERVQEGVYFGDFHKTNETDGGPWHVTHTLPTFQGESVLRLSWMKIYRALDWGYSPDPAVCLWIAVLPNKRAIVFKERHWKRTLPDVVARDIIADSKDMHVVDTFCDPVMLIKDGHPFSIGEIFEQNGVPVTASINDRMLYGLSIHSYLNTIIDERPQIEILATCRDLIRTIPLMRTDPHDASKIADGEDHWVVALAYFCMGGATPSSTPEWSETPRWMRPKLPKRRYDSAYS